MTKQLSFCLLIVCTSLMLAAAAETAQVARAAPRPLPDFFFRGQTAYVLRGQTNGECAAWIEERLVGSPNARALRFELRLYRRGPTNITPHLLLITRTPPGEIRFWLGPNGLLAAQAGASPRVYFPGRDEPHLLEAPQPAKTNSSYHPPHWSLDRCWFFGDVLVYDSRAYGGAEYLVGLFRIDQVKETVSPGRICLEISDTDGYLVKAAQVAGDRILHVGTHLLWENLGLENSTSPTEVKGTWRTRQLRAFDMESGRLLTGSEIPQEILARHKDSVARVFGPRKFR